MKNLRNLRNRPFLIVKTVQRPSNGVKTEQKGWNVRPNNWTLFEQPHLADRVSDKVMREATVIIDVMQSTCVKSRFTEAQEDEVVAHYLDKYKAEVQQAVDIWLSREMERFATANPDAFAEAMAEVKARAAEALVASGETDADVVSEEVAEAAERAETVAEAVSEEATS